MIPYTGANCIWCIAVKINLFYFLFKVGHKQKVELIPNKIHVMKTLSLKPLLFGKEKRLLEIYPDDLLVEEEMRYTIY